MISAFCPGHVTCFFQPVRTGDPVTSGSRGLGFKTSLGTTVSIDERADGKVSIVMDGKGSDCPITRYVLSKVCPGVGFDVIIDNALPVSQGFGTSAAAALAAAAAAAEFSGTDVEEAFRTAHVSDVIHHGGLGDVSAMLCRSHFPLRLAPGADGTVVDTKLPKTRFSLAVLGDALSTSSVISDAARSRMIEESGRRAIEDFDRDRGMPALFRSSRGFSSSVGLETFEISSFLSLFGESGMCMLGHTVFTTAPKDEITDLVGDVRVFECETTDGLPRVVRRA